MLLEPHGGPPGPVQLWIDQQHPTSGSGLRARKVPRRTSPWRRLIDLASLTSNGVSLTSNGDGLSEEFPARHLEIRVREFLPPAAAPGERDAASQARVTPSAAARRAARCRRTPPSAGASGACSSRCGAESGGGTRARATGGNLRRMCPARPRRGRGTAPPRTARGGPGGGARSPPRASRSPPGEPQSTTASRPVRSL